jgi:UDP-N-acetylenolpyruvoylglucosamine reductase
LRAGGGAANAVCIHHARRAGLGGLEFACAIPGTAGGGVRMNAGAYGSDWAQVLERALVVDAGGSAWRSAADLELTYRHSALAAGQIVAHVEFRLESRPPDAIRAAVAALNARRKAAQPTNRRTFGSVFKNPPGERGAGELIELCGLKGWRIGGAVISPRHANFIENSGEALAADALALMVEARRRVHEQHGVVLEHEVVLLGDLGLSPIT